MIRWIFLCLSCFPAFFCPAQEGSQTDSVLMSNWKISTFNTFTKNVPLDTNFMDQVQRASFYGDDYSVSSLGNSNSPAISNIFIYREKAATPFFLLPYQRFIFKPYDQIYFDTKKPYSEIVYFYLPGKKDKDDSRLSAILSQNVNPHLNVGLRLNFLNSDGQYLNQKTKIGGGNFFSSYSKGIYTVHFSLGLNKITITQNGGLYDITDAWNKEEDTKTLPVNLSGAYTQVSSRYLFVHQKLNFKADTTKLEDTRSHLSHTLYYSPNYRGYHDNLTAVGQAGRNAPDSIYYQRFDAYTTKDVDKQVIDTSYFKSLYNEIRYSQRIYKDKVSISGFWANKVDYYYSAYSDTSDSVIMDKSTQVSNYVGGLARLSISERSGLVAYARYCLSGYRQNDFFAQAILSTYFTDHFWTRVSGYYQFETPDYFLKRYRSSFYDWNNSLDPQMNYGVNGVLALEKLNLKIGGDFSVVQNYTYFDSTTLPKQAVYLEGITTFYGEHHLKLGVFNWENRLTYQKATSDVFSLPQWVWYTRLYLMHTINFKFSGGKIHYAIGGEAWYNSRFNSMNYSPLVEQFYYQSGHEGVDYTFSNLFLNVQVKRLRFFVRYENFTTLFYPSNYYLVNDYPYPRTAIKLGIAWTFYD